MAVSTHLPRLVRRWVRPEPIDVSSSLDGAGPGAPSPAAGHLTNREGAAPETAIGLDLDEVYREHFAFVWRSVKRLGVRDASLDDVVQEVFMIVHRRLGEFEGRSSIRTWLFGIALRVARDHKRSAARKDSDGSVDPDTIHAPVPSPAESMEKAEAVRLLYAILDEMEDERREVFVMAELEQMTMPDIAGMLGLNVNTAYARLRAARQTFESALGRRRAQDEWRLR